MAFDPAHFEYMRHHNPGSYEDDVLDRADSNRLNQFRPHKPSEEVAKLLADQE